MRAQTRRHPSRHTFFSLLLALIRRGRFGVAAVRSTRSLHAHCSRLDFPPLRHTFGHSVTDSATQPQTTNAQVPTRALASIVFACFSFWLMLTDLGASTGGLQNALKEPQIRLGARQSRPRDGLLHTYLAIGYGNLAVTALAWCIWSWRTEKGITVGVGALLAGLAVAASLLSFL